MSKFERDLLLGRMGEHIVERILSRAKFSVIPYGYERVAPSVVETLKFAKTEIAVRVRSAPDFLVVNQSGDPFLLQVKTTLSKSRYFTLHNDSYPEKEHWPLVRFCIVNLSPERFGVYAVERWGENSSEKHVYVYYNADHPKRGCSTRIENYAGFDQSIPKEVVEDVMAGHELLISQLRGSTASSGAPSL